MRLMPLLLVIVLLFCLNTVGMAQVDENAADTLKLSAAKLMDGNKVAVIVDFFNDQPLAALTIPLRLGAKGFEIDTVLLTDSRIDYLHTKPITITEDRQGVVFGGICMTEAYIPAGNGLLATIVLRQTGTELAKDCIIDTTTIIPANTLFTKPDSKSFVPVVQMGKMKIGKQESDPPKDTAKKE
ncbi:MAG: hypothetical protein R3F48_07070 [Candidatus Zixiibacteriota bacterium]